ncbi:tubulin nucleotide-binding domain-like protein [Conidiobolus coronatus NRRL 28638]|uniref:Tubulin nucleotide-binding domain-like protein n=1 Tax=Conidiobolus coronatus (strain ATCC 28846 / CBS 209.66 / NRRL 28638) TaxID=796925 RepID=A0A137NUB9_CONC2|nr:tubulin nucleotide-binding domain-like protein [Conidiobolus coronatus NRRL 28638]|eukprot:KXN66359.1 tubulin nucleotide-binding domain-like protein [Conidiobolus coronatus NRRL 28638]
MREIISLQFGSYSNWIATQLFNLNLSTKIIIILITILLTTPSNLSSEDLNSLFRFSSSKTNKPTPRALIFDTKGMVDLSYTSNNQPDKFIAWDNNPELYLQNRTSTTSSASWSDIDNNIYHPNSNLGIHQLQQNDQLKPMSSYFQGKEIMEQFEKETQVLDNNLRFFTEECDYLQGFLTYSNTFDGFSGFSQSYIDLIRDEYPKTSIINLMSMTCPESLNTKQHSYSIVNQGMALSDNHNMYDARIPLFWNKTQDIANIDKNPHHLSSSIIALAADSMLLKTKAKSKFMSLSELSLTVNPSGSSPISQLHFKAPLFSKHEIVNLSNPNQPTEKLEFEQTSNSLLSQRFINNAKFSNDNNGINQFSKIEDESFNELWR